MQNENPIGPRGLNIMLVGASGAGKTYSLRTLVDAGLDVFVIYTEPGMTTLGDLPHDHYHYHYIAPAAETWQAMLDSATKINRMTMKGLANLDGINKDKHAQYLELLTTCNNFVCDCCGESWGSTADWPLTRALVVDSLSGVNIMALNLVVGSKPVKSMGDWGIAMDNLNRFVTQLTTGIPCHFILTAHLEPERDEVTGRIENMPSILGRKLAPVLPRFFDDVIHCVADGDKFTWSTASGNVTTKARDLPIAANQSPSFVPLITKWRTNAQKTDNTHESPQAKMIADEITKLNP